MIRDLLGVKAVHAIGYCVAGRRGGGDACLSRGKAKRTRGVATFFTAQ